MSLLLDSREGSYPLACLEPIRSLLPLCSLCGGSGRATLVGQLTEECGKCRGTGRHLSHLTAGDGESGPDILICGNGPDSPLLIAVEVKSLRDLFQSADTGRLQAQGTGQLQLMRATYHQSWLVVYGVVRCDTNGHLEEPRGRNESGRVTWRPFTKTGAVDGKPVKYEFLERMLVEVAAMGIHVKQVGSENEVARWVGDVLYAWWSKPYAEHKFTHTFQAPVQLPLSIPGISPAEWRRAKTLLGDYPGLGPDRAILLAKHFGSVQDMANADEKELKRVPGIGKVIAGHLHKAFRS